MVKVVHNKREPYDVYIGRPSKWGNPFSVEKYGREGAISRYEEWLKTQPELMAALPELRGKVLGCWCAPKACHGDILARLANGKEGMEKTHMISFTGHTQLGEYEEITKAAITKFLKMRMEEHEKLLCITGGAAGVDTIAAEVCVELGIKFTIAYPDEGYLNYWVRGRGWSGTKEEAEAWLDRITAVEAKAHKIVYVNKEFPRKGNNFRRNDYMMTWADECLAVRYKDSPGTNHGIKSAKQHNCKLYIYNPSTKTLEE